MEEDLRKSRRLINGRKFAEVEKIGGGFAEVRLIYEEEGFFWVRICGN